MENSRIEQNESVRVPEVAKTGRIGKLIMAVSLAVMAALGGGCGKGPDSMDLCLGEKQASEHKSRLKKMKKVCGERVKDYVRSKDGDKRPILKNDANLACMIYSRELHVTEGLLNAKGDSARMDENWGKRDACEEAAGVTRNRLSALIEGDGDKLIKGVIE